LGEDQAAKSETVPANNSRRAVRLWPGIVHYLGPLREAYHFVVGPW
jgi:hypothetical protein